MSVNFSHYNTFLCVAEAGSISLASRKLGVSQPAVSAEISALEASLDTALFYRTSRGVTLTDAGKTLHEYVKRGISALRTGENKLRELKGLEAGSLRIGAQSDIISHLLFDGICAFTERYPAISVSFTSADEGTMLRGLKSGELDLAVLSDPISRQETEGLTLTPFFEVQDILISHPTAPICRESRVTKRRLAEHSMVLPPENSSQAKFMQSYIPQSPKAIIRTDSSDMAIRFSEMSVGVSSVVEALAAEAIREGRVMRIDLADKIPSRSLYIAAPAELTPCAGALRDIILEFCTRS